MLRIKKNFFKTIEVERFKTLNVEEIEVNRDQLKCFVIDKIEKIEIKTSNWLENTIVSWRIFSNILFLFIYNLLNIISWYSIFAISINTINFL